MTGPKRILTGSRPSGEPHIGNYFGAYKPLIDWQNTHDLMFFLADLHTLNSPVDRSDLESQSLDMIAALLACGFDPNLGCLYAQSSVPQVCELAWILSCSAPYGMLTRAHSFKDALAKEKEVNMGIFNYPVLMAADILLYDAEVVPVGQDQKQHLEMTRDIATRFNNRYGPVFRLPEPKISQDVAVVPGLDGEKMSKSKENVIPLFAPDKVWKKQVMAIRTGSESLAESKDPDQCTVYKLYSLLATSEEARTMAERYRAGGYGYGHAKLALLEQLQGAFSTSRDTYNRWRSKPDDLRDVVRQGSLKASAMANTKLQQIQDAVGCLGRSLIKGD